MKRGWQCLFFLTLCTNLEDPSPLFSPCFSSLSLIFIFSSFLFLWPSSTFYTLLQPLAMVTSYVHLHSVFDFSQAETKNTNLVYYAGIYSALSWGTSQRSSISTPLFHIGCCAIVQYKNKQLICLSTKLAGQQVQKQSANHPTTTQK